MTIKTKYNIGDEVWAIYEYQVLKFRIAEIRIKTNGKKTFVEYLLVYSPVEISEDDILSADIEIKDIIPERYLFPTKEELLKSL